MLLLFTLHTLKKGVSCEGTPDANGQSMNATSTLRMLESESSHGSSKHARHRFFSASHRRTFNVLLSVSIAAVSAAVTITLFQTSSLLFAAEASLFKVTTQVEELRSFGRHIHLYKETIANMLSENRTISPHELIIPEHTGSAAEHDYAFNKFFLVLDFWERMINVQSGLRRLVQLGVDSGFTVVEPFVYESKVSRRFSFPEHFAEKNMTPQTAALYFRTEDLYATNRYISHDRFRQKIMVADASRVKPKSSARHGQTMPDFIIQAVVYFDWSNSLPRGNASFWWCDGKLHSDGFPKSRYGRRLCPGVHAQRALCLASRRTMSPARFSASLFHELYAFAWRGTRRVRQACGRCTTLAFMNYRKHAFTGFVSHTGAMPFRQKTPPLEVGELPGRLADRVRADLLGGRPHVAIQLRTGKAFALLEHYEARLAAHGAPFERHAAFKGWLQSCTRRVAAAARAAARDLGGRPVFYVASDMYNDGWKGGEACPAEVAAALEAAKRELGAGLGAVRRFRPEAFGVRQDAMGLAGLADAAVCLRADRFVFARPSNFGRWVHEQRVGRAAGARAVVVDCMDTRFVGQ